MKSVTVRRMLTNPLSNDSVSGLCWFWAKQKTHTHIWLITASSSSSRRFRYSHCLGRFHVNSLFPSCTPPAVSPPVSATSTCPRFPGSSLTHPSLCPSPDPNPLPFSLILPRSAALHLHSAQVPWCTSHARSLQFVLRPNLSYITRTRAVTSTASIPTPPPLTFSHSLHLSSCGSLTLSGS